jgi:hypothetical protein
VRGEGSQSSRITVSSHGRTPAKPHASLIDLKNDG